MEEELTKQDLLLRKKQSTCHHYSWKCSCCGLYKDNLQNEYAKTISDLLKIIEIYEHALGIESTVFLKYEHYCHEKIHH